MASKYYFFKGRVALHAILKSMGIGPGDEIVLPGFTCVVVPNAIQYVGAKPIYVDIDEGSYNIDPSKIEEKITSATKAIIAQHTFGIPADMDAILDIARRYHLFVIEDSCHAIGSKYRGREVGTFGDAAFFSSQWSKPITTGLGGWAAINNPLLKEGMAPIFAQYAPPSKREEVLLSLQYFLFERFLTPSLFWSARKIYRMLSKAGICVGSSASAELDFQKPRGYEKRMSPWQKRTLETKLNHTKTLIAHRKSIVSIYESILPESHILTKKLPAHTEAILLRYPVRVGDRNALLESARANSIEIGDWFISPVHPQFANWEKASYQAGSCPKAEMACRQIVNLPTHPRITEVHAVRAAEFIRQSAQM